MPDEPKPEITPPPTADALIAQAERLKSQALSVGAARLIQESRHLREANDRKMMEAENLRKVAAKQKPRKNFKK
jgi:hypothetical protein